MDTSFKLFALNVDKVNENIRKDNEPTFSSVFHHLFPSNGKYSNSMKSFLSLVNDFRISDKMIEEANYKESNSVVTRLYEEFKIDRKKNVGVYQFWVYLIQMHDDLVKDMPSRGERQRPGFDNIFGFMTGFPFEKTRVVIIGNDPSPIHESSGYAYHGSNCRYTEVLVGNFMHNDLQIINNVCGTSITAEYSSNLDGWIEQGVLLFNTYLTYMGKLKYQWSDLTKLIVRQLSLRCDCLVFILTGTGPQQCFENLIDKEKHAVFLLSHPATPTSTGNPEFTWDDLPYFNANYYFYQKGKQAYMIDWVNVQNGKEKQLLKYTQCFKEITRYAEGQENLIRKEMIAGTESYFV